MKVTRRVKLSIFAVTAVFVLLITFILPNNILQSRKIKRSIQKMEREQAVHRESARRDSAFLENLKNDEFLEAYARTHFYMKRKGEEIYIVED